MVTDAVVDLTFVGAAVVAGAAVPSAVAAGVVADDTLVFTGLSNVMLTTCIPASLAYLLMSLII